MDRKAFVQVMSVQEVLISSLTGVMPSSLCDESKTVVVLKTKDAGGFAPEHVGPADVCFRSVETGRPALRGSGLDIELNAAYWLWTNGLWVNEPSEAPSADQTSGGTAPQPTLRLYYKPAVAMRPLHMPVRSIQHGEDCAAALRFYDRYLMEQNLKLEPRTSWRLEVLKGDVWEMVEPRYTER